MEGGSKASPIAAGAKRGHLSREVFYPLIHFLICKARQTSINAELRRPEKILVIVTTFNSKNAWKGAITMSEAPSPTRLPASVDLKFLMAISKSLINQPTPRNNGTQNEWLQQIDIIEDALAINKGKQQRA